MNPFFRDIMEQPKVLRDLAARWAEDTAQKDTALHAAQQTLLDAAPGGFLLTGMGSSLFAAYIGGLYLQDAGVPAVIVDASELLLYGTSAIPDQTTVIMVSQSGESVEIKELLPRLKKHRLVALTNEPDSPLAQAGDLCISLGVRSDHSIAAKTYMSSIALLLLLFDGFREARDVTPRRLESIAGSMESYLETWESSIEAALAFVEDAPYVTFLGYGPSLASAWEGALLFQEGAKRKADGASGSQFRHGLVEVVEQGFTSIVFAPSGRAYPYATGVINELLDYGGKVLMVSDEPPASGANLHTLSRPPSDEFTAPLLEILPIQLLVYELARRQGIEPGLFRNTTPIIRGY